MYFFVDVFVSSIVPVAGRLYFDVYRMKFRRSKTDAPTYIDVSALYSSLRVTL